jgi:hypothetical protein
MNLANRLFEIVDDEPVYSPVLVNLKCFKKLYEEDKSSDKSKYAQQLMYIWYLCDCGSPFFNSEDRETEVSNEVFGKKITITKSLQACVDEYKKRQSTHETRAFERTAMLCDNMTAGLTKDNQQLLEWERLIQDVNDLLKSLGKDPTDIEARFELMERKIDLEAKFIKTASDMSSMIPKIEKQVDALIELRKKVEKSKIDIDSDSNKDSISNFLIDEFIDKYN